MSVRVYSLVAVLDALHSAGLDDEDICSVVELLNPGPARRQAIDNGVREIIWIRDGGRCGYCGRTGEMQIDHIFPISKGGDDHQDNLVLACRPCNAAKRDKLPWNFEAAR